MLTIDVVGRLKPVMILMEARGASALLGALYSRGYFPDDVLGKSVRETNGQTHCLPVEQKNT